MERVYNFIIDFMQHSITATHKDQTGEFVYGIHKDIADIITKRDASRINDAIKASVDTWSVLQFPEDF